MQIPKSLQGHRGFHGVQGFTPLILRQLLQVLGEGAATSIFRRHEERWHFSWASFPQSHILMVRIEAQKEVGVGGQQMQVDQAVDNGLRLSAIILMNLGAPCWWAIRS